MQKSSSHPAAAVLASVLAEQGVRHAVVSPGSRNAPLVLALHHHPDIAVHVTIDERAAAHHALGLALATWTPVPVVCTSEQLRSTMDLPLQKPFTPAFPCSASPPIDPRTSWAGDTAKP